MAITYRGQASRLNKIESKQNASGFQEKSDPGPRQGVGGEDVSLKQAKASFEKRFSVAGAALTGKKFVDAGAEVGKLFEKKEKPKAADLSLNTEVEDTSVTNEDEPIIED